MMISDNPHQNVKGYTLLQRFFMVLLSLLPTNHGCQCNEKAENILFSIFITKDIVIILK